MRDIHVLNQRMLAVILGAAAQSHSGNTNGNGNVGVCAAASGIPYSAAQIFDNTMKHVYQRQIGVLRTAGYVAQNLPRKGDTVLCLHGRKNIIEDITDDSVFLGCGSPIVDNQLSRPRNGVDGSPESW